MVHRRSALVRVATDAFAMVLCALFFGLAIGDRLTLLALAALLGAIFDGEVAMPTSSGS